MAGRITLLLECDAGSRQTQAISSPSRGSSAGPSRSNSGPPSHGNASQHQHAGNATGSSSGPPGSSSAGAGLHASNAAVAEESSRRGAAVLVVSRPPSGFQLAQPAAARAAPFQPAAVLAAPFQPAAVRAAPFQPAAVRAAPIQPAAVRAAAFQPAQPTAVRPATGTAVAQMAAATPQTAVAAPQHGSSAGASMFGFPVDAAGHSVMANVKDIMSSRLQFVRYEAFPGMTSNGFPMANLTFPDLGSAQRAVQQLDGLRHGNMQVNMELGSSVQARPLPQPPYSNAAGPSQGPTSMQLLPPPLPPTLQAACTSSNGNDAQLSVEKRQASWRQYNMQANASANTQASGSAAAQANVSAAAQASGSVITQATGSANVQANRSAAAQANGVAAAQASGSTAAPANRSMGAQANGVAVAQARGGQPSGEQASSSQIPAGQTTLPPTIGGASGMPPLAAQGHSAMVQPPAGERTGPATASVRQSSERTGSATASVQQSSERTGSVTASVQQSSERLKLIEQIYKQLMGDGWETCREFGDLKVKLNKMKVLLQSVHVIQCFVMHILFIHAHNATKTMHLRQF